MKKEELKIAKTRRQKFAKLLRPIQPAPMLTKEQSMMQELFGGSERIWGTGEDLPKLNGSLMSETMNGETIEENTADMFSIRKRRNDTGEMFGI